MSVVVNAGETNRPPVPVAEQTKLVEYVMSLVGASGLFVNVPVKLNFVDADVDCVCVRLLEESYKTAVYVDGSYEAQVAFAIIYRRLNITSADERLHVIDVVNQFGSYLESLEEFVGAPDGVEINGITQKNPAGILYRDESGTEDNGANFVLKYDKN